MNKKCEYFFSIAAMVLLLCMSGYLKGQATEHPLLAVQQDKKQTDIKQDRVSRAERVKQVLSLDGAVVLPIVSGAFCSTGAAMLLDRNKKKSLQSFVFMFLASVLGSIGGYWATKLLRDFSYKKKASALAKGQTDEHPVLVVQQDKKQIYAKQDPVSRAERVKQVVSFGGAAVLPIISGGVCAAGGAMLCDRFIKVNEKNLNDSREKKKFLQTFALMFFSSVAGSCGGFFATKFLPTHSVYKTTVAVLAIFPMPISITYGAVKSGLLLCFR